MSLTPEEAKERLKQFANPNAREELRARARELPAELAELALGVVDQLSSRILDAAKRREEAERWRAIEALSLQDRRKLFEVFFLPIAEHVEASWQLQLRLPYQSGLLRKAFRAPSHPAYTAKSRAEWVEALLRATLPYRYDLEFLAVWAPHLSWGAERYIGLLLAAVLDSDHPDRQRIYDTLLAIINGQHEIGRIGRYAVIAMLSCSRPEAWDAIERLLLAAQRQEGLRQVVLESVDFAHRDAFTRMLTLIQREKLSRFAAVARAAAVWFGMSVDSADAKLIDGLVAETVENLQNQELLAEHLKSSKGQSLYLALWARAFDNAVQAAEDADRISHDADFDRRYAAVHLLSQLGTTQAGRILVRCLDDEDLRIALKSAEVIPAHLHPGQPPPNIGDVFAPLQRLIARTPKEKILEPAIWEWNRIAANRSALVRKLITYRGERPFSELSAHVGEMDPMVRRHFLQVMKKAVAERKQLLPDEREIAVSLLSDASAGTRQAAFEILQEAPTLSPDEAASIEPLLSRKASDLRRGVIRLLLKQDAAACHASIERLSGSRDPLMVKAAGELRSELAPKTEAPVSLDDGLGLFRRGDRTQPTAPNGSLTVQLRSEETGRILQSLDALVDRYRETPITRKLHSGRAVEQLFGNSRYLEPKEDFPLSEVWHEWWRSFKAESASPNLARALCTVILAPHDREAPWSAEIARELAGDPKLKFRKLVLDVAWHLMPTECAADDVSVMLDALELYMHRLAAGYKPEPKRPAYHPGWRSSQLRDLLRVTESCRRAKPDVWSDAHWRRYWNLLRWVDEGVAGENRQRPFLETTLDARRRGAATDADLIEQLLGPRTLMGRGLTELAVLTKRKPAKQFEAYPELTDFVARCRDRVLEVELKRGDLPTPASTAALSLRSIHGAEIALTILKELGKEPLSRGYLSDNESKTVIFSHLLRVCLPAEDDTPETFANAAKRHGIARNRLFDLGVYAPQWAEHVAHATGIAGFTAAAYWLHAHTKDTHWTVDPEIRELWFAEVSARTPLLRQELLDGAVDVEWFQRVRGGLSKKDWELTLDSAKYASGGAGHKRAELFAAAISGEAKTAALSKQILEKRSQDAVRAIGLVPLPPNEPKRRQEILHRYDLLQKFVRGSHKFGAMRQASEKLACSIGLANLARTAGYADPLRLSWAMEALASEDLRSGSVTAADGGVQAVLSIDALGEPQLAYEKNGKPLKDVPASLRKSPDLSALRIRKTELAQQTSRMRQSLEEAMIRGDCFTVQDLAELELHPSLKPMVSTLLFADEDGTVLWHRDLNGQSGQLRIAHPVDLLKSGEWPRRQRECLESERTQPFKQAFRELYLLTPAEREQQTFSGRYEGQQVNPKQATAVIGKRGWVNVPEEGLRKTYHHDNVSAWVTFLEGWFTPADVDGLTVQHVVFTNRSDGKIVPLDQIGDRVFSETMRDLDLMVSVAHRGGVDPEATASTIEMRIALLRETLHLLNLQNVRLEGRYAFVDGKIGAYNIHLGSGTVHRQPGGSLCIIPVHSQHRGRLFLPFADDDPKTAEIVSKVLLLAQDHAIQDPTILEQLR